LPTEAEWEYACRAGTTTAYSFGDDPGDLGDYAVYFDNCDDGYAKVGSKKPNPWGLYDMHGNVAEWTLDQLIPDYYAKLASGQAKGPFAVPTELYPRVARGGHWDADPKDLRSAARLGSDPSWKMQDPQIPRSIWYHTDATFVGFRVVRPLRVPSVEEANLYEPDPEIMREYREAQGGKE
jgi:formylglycine-generating enzyme required for sulfatase activity